MTESQTISPPAIELDADAILRVLPHRYPLLLVDRVVRLRVGESIVARKNITFSEPQFQGHFPLTPVMPGVLMIEALAQTSAILALLTAGVDRSQAMPELLFAGIERARFRRVVRPGDALILHSQRLQKVKTLERFAVRATLDSEDGPAACEAQLYLAWRGKGAGE